MSWNSVLFDSAGVIKDIRHSVGYDFSGLTVRSSTFHSIGMTLDLAAGEDPNHEYTMSVLYRIVGPSEFSEGLPLIRNDYSWFWTDWWDYDAVPPAPFGPPANNLSGSLCFLTPGTTYEIELTLKDGATTLGTITFQTTTRAIPIKSTPTNTYYAEQDHPGTNVGTDANPFNSLASCNAAAVPGDLFLLRDTGGPFTNPDSANGLLTTSGDEDNHIVYEPDSLAHGGSKDHSPIIDSIGIEADHIWLDKLDYRFVDRDSKLQTFVDANVNISTNRITLAGHGFSDSYAVYLPSTASQNPTGTLPTGLLNGTKYYVKSIDVNTIELYTDAALNIGDIADITAATGGETYYISTWIFDQFWWDTAAIYVPPNNIANVDIYDDIIITDSTFDAYENAAFSTIQISRWVAMDNSVVGFWLEGCAEPDAPLAAGSSGKAFALGGESSWGRSNGGLQTVLDTGMVVAFNDITRVTEGVEMYENSDVYSNRIWDNIGNAISCDNSYGNVRIWGNEGMYAHGSPMSWQPQRIGPWYWMYNQFGQVLRNVFKFRTSDRSVLINNNFLTQVSAANNILDMYTRNNLFVVTTGTAACWNSTFGQPPVNSYPYFEGSWSTDLDYDAFDPGTQGNIFFWSYAPLWNSDRQNYNTIASFTADVYGTAVNMHENAIVFDASLALDGWTASLVGSTSHHNPLVPKSDVDYGGPNPLVATGQIVPNLCDWHGAVPGTTLPDRGAYQRGAAPLQIGVRTSELSLPLHQRTLHWDKH